MANEQSTSLTTESKEQLSENERMEFTQEWSQRYLSCATEQERNQQIFDTLKAGSLLMRLQLDYEVKPSYPLLPILLEMIDREGGDELGLTDMERLGCFELIKAKICKYGFCALKPFQLGLYLSYTKSMVHSTRDHSTDTKGNILTVLVDMAAVRRKNMSTDTDSLKLQEEEVIELILEQPCITKEMKYELLNLIDGDQGLKPKQTALHSVITRSNIYQPLVLLLLKHGADINVTSPEMDLMPPLMHCIRFDNIELLIGMILSQADLTTIDINTMKYRIPRLSDDDDVDQQCRVDEVSVLSFVRSPTELPTGENLLYSTPRKLARRVIETLHQWQQHQRQQLTSAASNPPPSDDATIRSWLRQELTTLSPQLFSYHMLERLRDLHSAKFEVHMRNITPTPAHVLKLEADCICGWKEQLEQAPHLINLTEISSRGRQRTLLMNLFDEGFWLQSSFRPLLSQLLPLIEEANGTFIRSLTFFSPWSIFTVLADQLHLVAACREPHEQVAQQDALLRMFIIFIQQFNHILEVFQSGSYINNSVYLSHLRQLHGYDINDTSHDPQLSQQLFTMLTDIDLESSHDLCYLVETMGAFGTLEFCLRMFSDILPMLPLYRSNESRFFSDFLYHLIRSHQSNDPRLHSFLNDPFFNTTDLFLPFQLTPSKCEQPFEPIQPNGRTMIAVCRTLDEYATKCDPTSNRKELVTEMVQLEENWNRIHWPAIRTNLDAYLISDLTAIVMSYLNAPNPASHLIVTERQPAITLTSESNPDAVPAPQLVGIYHPGPTVDDLPKSIVAGEDKFTASANSTSYTSGGTYAPHSDAATYSSNSLASQVSLQSPTSPQPHQKMCISSQSHPSVAPCSSSTAVYGRPLSPFLPMNRIHPQQPPPFAYVRPATPPSAQFLKLKDDLAGLTSDELDQLMTYGKDLQLKYKRARELAQRLAGLRSSQPRVADKLPTQPLRDWLKSAEICLDEAGQEIRLRFRPPPGANNSTTTVVATSSIYPIPTSTPSSSSTMPLAAHSFIDLLVKVHHRDEFRRCDATESDGDDEEEVPECEHEYAIHILPAATNGRETNPPKIRSYPPELDPTLAFKLEYWDIWNLFDPSILTDPLRQFHLIPEMDSSEWTPAVPQPPQTRQERFRSQRERQSRGDISGRSSCTTFPHVPSTLIEAHGMDAYTWSVIQALLLWFEPAYILKSRGVCHSLDSMVEEHRTNRPSFPSVIAINHQFALNPAGSNLPQEQQIQSVDRASSDPMPQQFAVLQYLRAPQPAANSSQQQATNANNQQQLQQQVNPDHWQLNHQHLMVQQLAQQQPLQQQQHSEATPFMTSNQHYHQYQQQQPPHAYMADASGVVLTGEHTHRTEVPAESLQSYLRSCTATWNNFTPETKVKLKHNYEAARLITPSHMQMQMPPLPATGEFTPEQMIGLMNWNNSTALDKIRQDTSSLAYGGPQQGMRVDKQAVRSASAPAHLNLDPIMAMWNNFTPETKTRFVREYDLAPRPVAASNHDLRSSQQMLSSSVKLVNGELTAQEISMIIWNLNSLLHNSLLREQLERGQYSRGMASMSTNTLGPTASSLVESNSVNAQPPAPPLVGIETNPGPVEFRLPPIAPRYTHHISTTPAVDCNPGPTQSTTSECIRDEVQPCIGVTRLSPQTMFKDGVHLIYSSLNLRDWTTTLLVCRHWSDCAANSPSVGAAFPIEKDGSILVPSPRLRHHFKYLCSRPPNTSVPWLTIPQLTAIGEFLHYVEQIRCFYDAKSRFNSQWSESMPPLIWPQTLKLLDVHILIDGSIASLIRQIPSCRVLIHLTFHDLSMIDFSCFSFLSEMASLESFEIHVYRCTPLGDTSVDVLNAMGFKRFPPSLRHLNINDGSKHYLNLTTLVQLEPANLEDIRVDNISADELRLLLVHTPNLTQWRLINDYRSYLALLPQFHALQSLEVGPPLDEDQGSLQFESTFTSAISACTNLTSIRFELWSPTSSSSWTTLAQALTKLTDLDFCYTHTKESSSFDDFLPFHHLTRLSFSGILNRPTSDRIKEYFRSSSVMPNLRRIEMSRCHPSWVWFQGMMPNYEGFRIPPTTQINPLPQPDKEKARLIGVELNPGPEEHKCPAPSVLSSTTCATSPQLLFKEGLHLISSYLSLNDWLNSLRTCRNWYETVKTQPCRHLTAHYDSLLPSPSVESTINLHRHFTQLTPRSRNHHDGYIVSPSILFRLIKIFPNLTSIKDGGVEKDASHITDCEWPIGLTSLSLMFMVEVDFRNLVSSMRQQLSHQLVSLDLRLEIDPIQSGFTWLECIQHFTALTSLAITYHETGENAKIDFIRDIPWTHLSQTLTYLNLQRGADVALDSIHTIPPLLNLTFLDLSRRDLRAGDLARFYSIAPNITSLFLKPYIVDRSIEVLAHLSLFQSLHSLLWDGFIHSSWFKQSIITHAKLLSILGDCPYLTRLYFLEHVSYLVANEAWLEMSNSISPLHWLDRFHRQHPSIQCQAVMVAHSFCQLASVISQHDYRTDLFNQTPSEVYTRTITCLFIPPAATAEPLESEHIARVNVKQYRLPTSDARSSEDDIPTTPPGGPTLSRLVQVPLCTCGHSELAEHKYHASSVDVVQVVNPTANETLLEPELELSVDEREILTWEWVQTYMTNEKKDEYMFRTLTDPTPKAQNFLMRVIKLDYEIEPGYTVLPFILEFIARDGSRKDIHLHSNYKDRDNKPPEQLQLTDVVRCRCMKLLHSNISLYGYYCLLEFDFHHQWNPYLGVSAPPEDWIFPLDPNVNIFTLVLGMKIVPEGHQLWFSFSDSESDFMNWIEKLFEIILEQPFVTQEMKKELVNQFSRFQSFQPKQTMLQSLMTASNIYHPLCRCLLKYGADVNLTAPTLDLSKDTAPQMPPLMAAIYFDHVELMVEMLLAQSNLMTVDLTHLDLDPALLLLADDHERSPLLWLADHLYHNQFPLARLAKSKSLWSQHSTPRRLARRILEHLYQWQEEQKKQLTVDAKFEPMDNLIHIWLTQELAAMPSQLVSRHMLNQLHQISIECQMLDPGCPGEDESVLREIIARSPVVQQLESNCIHQWNTQLEQAHHLIDLTEVSSLTQFNDESIFYINGGSLFYNWIISGLWLQPSFRSSIPKFLQLLNQSNLPLVKSLPLFFQSRSILAPLLGELCPISLCEDPQERRSQEAVFLQVFRLCFQRWRHILEVYQTGSYLNNQEYLSQLRLIHDYAPDDTTHDAELYQEFSSTLSAIDSASREEVERMLNQLGMYSSVDLFHEMWCDLMSLVPIVRSNASQYYYQFLWSLLQSGYYTESIARIQSILSHPLIYTSDLFQPFQLSPSASHPDDYDPNGETIVDAVQSLVGSYALPQELLIYLRNLESEWDRVIRTSLTQHLIPDLADLTMTYLLIPPTASSLDRQFISGDCMHDGLDGPHANYGTRELVDDESFYDDGGDRGRGRVRRRGGGRGRGRGRGRGM